MIRKDTFDYFDSEQISDMSRWNSTLTDKSFMRKIYWDILEHDWSTSRNLSKPNVKYAPAIRKALLAYRKAEDKCRSLLNQATKNSPKF